MSKKAIQEERPELFFNARYKDFGDHFKLTVFDKKIFYTGIRRPLTDEEKAERKARRKATETHQRADSLKRSRDAVFEIALSNRWDYWITFTLDRSKIDRYDNDLITKKLKIFLSNQVQRKNALYLIVPELHKKGGVHFHGLYRGELELTPSGKKDRQGHEIFNSGAWPYGFSTVVKLWGEPRNVAKYLTKYLSKNQAARVLNKYYFAGGKGLIRSVPAYYCNKDFMGCDYDKLVKIDKPDVKISIKYKTFFDINGDSDEASDKLVFVEN